MYQQCLVYENLVRHLQKTGPLAKLQILDYIHREPSGNKKLCRSDMDPSGAQHLWGSPVLKRQLLVPNRRGQGHEQLISNNSLGIINNGVHCGTQTKI